MFLDPTREAADPGFEFHVLIASDQIVGNTGGDFMFVLVLVSMFFMTLLTEPTADLAIHLAELMANGTPVAELPESPLQLPVSAKFLSVEPQTGFLQSQEGATELIEINLRSDRTLLGKTFDPEEKH